MSNRIEGTPGRQTQPAGFGEELDLENARRRYVQALLEHLDSERVTVRRGDERLLRGL